MVVRLPVEEVVVVVECDGMQSHTLKSSHDPRGVLSREAVKGVVVKLDKNLAEWSESLSRCRLQQIILGSLEIQFQVVDFVSSNPLEKGLERDRFYILGHDGVGQDIPVVVQY